MLRAKSIQGSGLPDRKESSALRRDVRILYVKSTFKVLIVGLQPHFWRFHTYCLLYARNSAEAYWYWASMSGHNGRSVPGMDSASGRG